MSILLHQSVVVVGANSVDRLSLATRTSMVGRGFITCGDDGLYVETVDRCGTNEERTKTCVFCAPTLWTVEECTSEEQRNE